MSAWIVSKEHIDVLVKARKVYAPHYWSGEFEPDETGRMLWRENLRSVEARYPDTVDNGDYPGPVSFTREQVDEYLYRDPRFAPSPGEIFKALGCFEYQSCETDDWEETEARKWCRELADVVASTLYEGPWGWDAEEITKRRELVPA